MNTKSIFNFLGKLFNTRAAGLYILIFAFSIGLGTFIENDFGTSSAKKLIYNTVWFELLLFLFSISLIVNIIKFRMIPQKKWALMTFHLAMIIILIGAATTRYMGFEGVMHIREGDTSTSIQSAETYLNINIKRNNKTYKINEKVLFASLGDNHWQKSYQIEDDIIDVKVNDFIPNPKEVLADDENGKPFIKIVLGSANGREEYYVGQGDKKQIRGVLYNFSEPEINGAWNIAFKDKKLLLKVNKKLIQRVMATQKVDTIQSDGTYHTLMLRSLYTDGQNNVVFGAFNPSANVKLISEQRKVKKSSVTALDISVNINGKEENKLVFGQKGLVGRPVFFENKNIKMRLTYGSKIISLPFGIKLYDFILLKYPGTNSASSYSSDVQLIDTRVDLKKDTKIFMNHILDYDGYRFFQSSFDKDELGTYLSVNHDFWGTWISYMGYILLTIGLIMSMFSKKSRFYQISQTIKKLRMKNSRLVWFGLFFTLSFSVNSQTRLEATMAASVAKEHADIVSRLIVQDNKGRMKPLHTLSREIVRKLFRAESYKGLTADQVFLSMYVNNREWQLIPLIKIGKHPDLKKLLDSDENYHAYNDFFDANGSYKLKDAVRNAYNMEPSDRGVFEKELIKLDEKINIASMIFSGSFLKVIPLENDKNNTWVSSISQHGNQVQHSNVADNFFSTYKPALLQAISTNDYKYVNKILSELDSYQRNIGSKVIPSDNKRKAEILLNNLNVFSRLAFLYFILGISLLILLFISVFKPSLNLSLLYKGLFILLVIGFLFHTTGLGLRWFISGRAPWSNGYESMIYIAWTSTLAGLIFARKSLGGLAATMFLAATVLFVAYLSYLDPEITPLVPVLKSYWLTIHVSLEAGSYGFLMLGAIIGLINLILMIFLTKENSTRVKNIIMEMTLISEMTLIGGLTMVSIGTYLGGVWANESWGRYWGWDAKETWALVTILVYAFILHMRLIPKLYGLFSFNLATIFGWATVIMTYYGVNYYLSGLHSYATGDPVPIPQWVYYVVVSVFIVAILSYWKKSKFLK